VRVLEAATDRDLTRQVLTQVILEMQAPLDLIPVDLLHTILRVQGTIDQAPFTAALAVVTRQIAEQGGLWAQQLAALMGGVPGFTAAPRPPSPAPAGTPGPIPGETADPPEPAPDRELTDLRARMNALLERMNRR
jgi:hypothetical protein